MAKRATGGDTDDEGGRSADNDNGERGGGLPRGLLLLLRLRHAWGTVLRSGDRNMPTCAIDEAASVLKEAKESQNTIIQTYALLVQGACCHMLQQHDRAQDLLRRALRIANDNQSKPAIAVCLGKLGESCMSSHTSSAGGGQLWEKAKEALQSGLLLTAKMKDDYGQIEILTLLSKWFRMAGDTQKFERISEYRGKRERALAESVAEAKASDDHRIVISWNGSL